ncbi:arginase family protein [Glaciihabitans tibetensis]|uniref:arginase family protein n=1 Tax=Glaciihabitans tibetensis TaxID=1266600 RepID=UPI0015E635A5|nr:arginase family protein [Glaciihabitans tibetensis]
MTVTFMVVPQWQGSGSSRAMRLVEGARSIQTDLPTSRTRAIEIPLEAGDDQGSGVARLSSLQIVRDNQLHELRQISSVDPDAWALTIGGDCAVELAAVTHVLSVEADVAVLWFDAHGDLHTPETSPSGAFHGMVVRTLLGEGNPTLLPETALPPDRLVMVGTRALDDAEAAFVDSAGITVLPPDASPQSLLDAVAASGATSVYIHIDLDVLDPAEISGVGFPEPFGITAVALVELITAAKQRFRLVGAGITEFAPADAGQILDDQPTILRLIGALTRDAS